MAISAVPNRKKTDDRAIQWLSPAFGSVAVVAVVALGLEDLLTVVLVTALIVVAAVLVEAVAGVTVAPSVSSVIGPAAGSPAAR